MGRAPRVDIDGGWQHVMNRGAGRQTIFHLAADGRQFLRLVAEGCDRSGVRVGAYCLMGNHFHLLVRCPEGGLSSFMHRLGSMYTRYVNVRTGSDGPIFRSRFHSVVVDTDAYLAAAGRYIHRNPLDIRPSVALDEYQWSSYRHYVGSVRIPPWLSTDELLEGFATAERYRDFVEDDHPGRPPVRWAVDVAIAEVDDDEFIATPRIRRTVLLALLDRADVDGRRDIEAVVDFGPGRSGPRALARNRVRVAAAPGIAAIADRALTLLPG